MGVALSERDVLNSGRPLELAIPCERPRDIMARQVRSGSTKALDGATQFRDFRLRYAYEQHSSQPRRNALPLQRMLWKFVKAECLHGRYYATFAPLNMPWSTCLEDREGRHKAKLDTLLTLKFQLFNAAP